MFLFDPKLDEIYVGNIIKTYVSSNICFRFDPTLRVGLSNVILTDVRLLDVASVFPSGQKRRSRFPVLDVFWTSFGREFSSDI